MSVFKGHSMGSYFRYQSILEKAYYRIGHSMFWKYLMLMQIKEQVNIFVFM